MKLSTGSWRLFFKPSLGIAGVGLDHAGPFKIFKPHLPRLDIQLLTMAGNWVGPLTSIEFFLK
jgi:hypothetical protein